MTARTSVSLSTVLYFSKGNERKAAADADARRTKLLLDPGAAESVSLPKDEFETVAARRADFQAASGNGPVSAQITGIWAGESKGGLPRIRWHGPGDAESFYMAVKINSGDRRSVVPELWTNLNHGANPSDFEAHPMELVAQNGDTAIYKSVIPIQRQGEFRVTGRISTSGDVKNPNWQWAQNSGVGDLRLRPRAVENENISEQIVHVGLANANPDGSSISTFRDLMDPTFGKYNIAAIKAAGKNTIRIQPPFRHDRWDQAHPYDSLGSPYAATDFFSIDPRYSRDAQAALANGSVQSWDKDKLRTIANAEFWDFVKAAHASGMKVMLDIALNHTGHNTTVRDLFDDPVNGERVLRNNFDQIAVDDGQAAVIRARMQNNPNGSGEELYPEMFANKNHDPAGAHSVNDMMGGGNGEWADTKQLNTGAFNWGGEIYDTPTNRSVTDWHARILKFWAQPPASEVGAPKDGNGVDGYRLDHSTNMPPEFWERALTQAQAMIDKPLAIVQEDFNQQERLRVWGDAMESGWFHDVINNFKAGSADGIWGIVGSDYFYETLRGGNHDEDRISTLFDGNLMATGRYLAMLDLFGGLSSTVMGDEFGEGQKLEFKHQGGVPSVLVQAKHNALPAANVDLQQAMKRAGEAKNSDPSLKTILRTRIYPDSPAPQLLGVARHSDDRSVPGTLVIANLANSDTLSNKFWLDDETRSRIDPNGLYEVRDLMSTNQGRELWPNWRKGQDLLDQGVYVQLSPYQIQALKIERKG